MPSSARSRPGSPTRNEETIWGSPTSIASYRRPRAGTQPDYDYPPYASTAKRHPTQPLVVVPQTLSEITGPVFGYGEVKPTDSDLTRQHSLRFWRFPQQ